jgi:uncharacterized phage-associated protein
MNDMLHLTTTIQLAARFLQKDGGRMPYLKLLKLMYYADRQMLVTQGTLITFDKWVAMKLGPVLSSTYHLICHPDDDNEWARHIETQGYDVVLVNDPGHDELNRVTQRIVDQVYEAHGHKGEFEIAYGTHDLSEYDNPEQYGLKVKELPYETVLEVEGLPFEEIERVMANIDAENSVDRVLSRVA